MVALQALHFPKEHREVTDVEAPGGTEASVRFPNALSGFQDPGFGVQEGVGTGQSTKSNGGGGAR